MAIRITCPGCETSLTLDDEKGGKKVRCRACQKVLNVPSAGVKAGAPRRVPVAQDEELVEDDADDEERDEAEDRPAKKKKKKKKQPGFPVLIVSVAAAVVLVLVIGGGVLTYFLTRPVEAAPQKQQQAEQPAPPPAGGGGVQIQKKGGGNLVSNIRNAAYLVEVKNELAQIKLSYVDFADNNKGASRTLENYLVHIKTFGKIHEKVKNGDYQINLKYRPENGNSVIAYEKEPYPQGYLSVWGSGGPDYLSEPEWKAGLQP